VWSRSIYPIARGPILDRQDIVEGLLAGSPFLPNSSKLSRAAVP
jgi:hypothetical protein